MYEVLSPLGVIWDARNLRRIHDQTPPDRDDGEATRRSERLAALLGRTGRSLIPLWPSGLAEFDGLRIDAIADGGMS